MGPPCRTLGRGAAAGGPGQPLLLSPAGSPEIKGKSLFADQLCFRMSVFGVGPGEAGKDTNGQGQTERTTSEAS